jgi:hypothetical protein
VQSGRTTNARGGNGGSGVVIIAYSYLTQTAPVISVTNSSNLIYKTVTSLKSSTPVDGRVTFYWKGKRIPRCLRITPTLNGSNYEATCNWAPSGRGATTITATVTPSDPSAGNITGTAQFFVLNRRSAR